MICFLWVHAAVRSVFSVAALEASNLIKPSMQIICFPKSRDVRAELSAMAASPSRLDAPKGQKLLDLVQHLEAQGWSRAFTRDPCLRN